MLDEEIVSANPLVDNYESGYIVSQSNIKSDAIISGRLICASLNVHIEM